MPSLRGPDVSALFLALRGLRGNHLEARREKEWRGKKKMRNIFLAKVIEIDASQGTLTLRIGDVRSLKAQRGLVGETVEVEMTPTEPGIETPNLGKLP